MGSAKRQIEDYIEGHREMLETDFLKANMIDFIGFLNLCDTNLKLGEVFDKYFDELRAQEFWDFCAEDLNGNYPDPEPYQCL